MTEPTHSQDTQAASDKKQQKPAAGPGGPLLLAVLVALAIMPVPRIVPDTDGDSGWSAVLSHAHQQGWQFGTDLVFTYGPAGFLVSRYFSASDAGVRMVSDALFGFAVAAGVCLLGWRMRFWWACLLLGTLVWVSANLDPRSDFLFEVGLLCWGLLCLGASGRRLAGCLLGFGALAVFGALVKGTFLFMSALSVGVVVVDLALRGKFKTGAALAAGFCAGIVLGWLAAGQNLLHLGRFLARTAMMVWGYDQAMAIEGLQTLRWRAGVIVLLGAAVVLLRALAAYANGEENRGWRQALLLGWASALLFIVWKHGFVIAESAHMAFFFGFVPILALALEALPCELKLARPWVYGGTAVCCLLPLLTLQAFFFLNGPRSLNQAVWLCRANFESLWRPAQYHRQMQPALEQERRILQLPQLRQIIGGRSVDVFGCLQSYALYNGLNYRPRPVFQSYAAYSDRLMGYNEQFYRSASPEYVLFTLQPPIRRFPPLEDARVLRALLLDYEPVALETPFVLLKAKGAPSNPAPEAPASAGLGAGQTAAPPGNIVARKLPEAGPPRAISPGVQARLPARVGLNLVRQGTVRPGESIDLRGCGEADLWMELELKPSWQGRLRSFFYKPGKVWLAAWREPGKDRLCKLPAPAPMLAAGFPASPLLLNDDDVLACYCGNAMTQPGAYSIEVNAGEERLWQPAIRFRVYRLAARLGRCAPHDLAWRLNYPGFQVAPTEVTARFKAVVNVGGKLALCLASGGYMRLTLPPGTSELSGRYGLAPAPWANPAANERVEFRVSEEMADGTLQLLHARTLRRGVVLEGGLQAFSVSLAGDGEHKLLLKTAVPGRPDEPAEAAACWADLAPKPRSQ